MNDKNDMNGLNSTDQVPYIISSSLKEAKTFSLTDLFIFLGENAVIIFLSWLVVIIIALVYLFGFAEPVYNSTSTLIPSSNTESLADVGRLASQFGFNIPGGSEGTDLFSGEMYLKIIGSRTLAGHLLDRTFSTTRYGEEKKLLQILTYGDDEPEFGLDTLREMGIDLLLEEIISGSLDGESGLLTLRISSFEPKLSEALNWTIIEELDSLQKSLQLKRVAEKLEFIEGRTETVKEELEQSEEKLRRFREANRQVESPSLLLEQERLTREIEVQTGVFLTLKQQLEMAKIDLIQKKSLIQILDPPNIPVRRSSPNSLVIAIIASVIGVLLGAGVAVTRVSLRSLREKDIEKFNKLKSFIFLKAS